MLVLSPLLGQSVLARDDKYLGKHLFREVFVLFVGIYSLYKAK